ncbi:hypothetical protein JOM56_015532 [Amanita muscaria]
MAGLGAEGAGLGAGLGAEGIILGFERVRVRVKKFYPRVTPVQPYFSCGVLAKVAFDWVVTEAHPKTSPFDARAARITAFIDVANLILEHTANEDSEAMAYDMPQRDFTFRMPFLGQSFKSGEPGQEDVTDLWRLEPSCKNNTHTSTVEQKGSDPPNSLKEKAVLLDETPAKHEVNMNNTGIKKQKLTDFFSIESREEKEDCMACSWDNLRVEHDKRARQAALEESKRVEQVREGNRLRKQKQHAKEKEQKMADSEANPKNWVGASIVAAEQLEIKHFSQKLLRAFDDVDNKSESLAEMSQPGRQFREAMKKKRKPQGRKSTHSSDGTLNVIRTHWKNPLIWPHIEAAVARAGWPWSPREICKKAVNINPQMFQGLTEQVCWMLD